MSWKPIDKDTPRDRVLLLTSDNPKVRYPVIMGRWDKRFNEWRSEPGAWPYSPTGWMNPPKRMTRATENGDRE